MLCCVFVDVVDVVFSFIKPALAISMHGSQFKLLNNFRCLQQLLA